MVSVTDVRGLQQALFDLNAIALGDLTKLWNLIVDRDLDPVQVRDMLVDAAPDLVLPYVSAATQMTAEWYDALLPEAAYRAVTAPLPEAEMLAASARWAAEPMFHRTRRGRRRRATPLDRMAATTQRRIFNGSRETITANAELEPGTRWARYASANACEFCRMLAAAGAVYTSAAAAVSVVGRGRDGMDARRRGRRLNGVGARGNQALGARFHDNCRCMAVPVRPGQQYTPPPYVEEWAAEYAAAVEAAGGSHTPTAVLAEMRRIRAERGDPAPPQLFDIPAPAQPDPEPEPEPEQDAPAPEPEAEPEPAPSRRRSPYAGQSLDDLAAALELAIAEERWDDLDPLEAEINRREDAARKARERRARQREERAAAQDAEYERLIADGVDDEEAIEQAYGVSVTEQRRRNARASLTAWGYTGRSLRDQIKAWHRDEAYRAYLAAEDATNGMMLRRQSEGRVDPASLWFANEATARRHASEELLQWWDEHGRITAAELEAQLLDPTELARIQSGQRDYLT